MKLNIGDKAPVFQGKDQDGNEVKLENFLGKKVVLYFYPNDDTPGCTIQSCNLRDNYQRLLSHGYEVIGISGNDEESHRKFREKYNLPFTLIADTDKSINEQYGVWVEKNQYGRTFMGTARTTFIIDEQGIIEDIISKVDKENHADQILNQGAEIEKSIEEPVQQVQQEVSEIEEKMESNIEEKEVEVVKTKAKKAASKSSPKKVAAPKKKVAAKKSAAKKPASKKAVAKKKPVVKKAATKKAAPKKKTATKKKPVVKKVAAKKSCAEEKGDSEKETGC